MTSASLSSVAAGVYPPDEVLHCTILSLATLFVAARAARHSLEEQEKRCLKKQHDEARSRRDELFAEAVRRSAEEGARCCQQEDHCGDRSAGMRRPRRGVSLRLQTVHGAARRRRMPSFCLQEADSDCSSDDLRRTGRRTAFKRGDVGHASGDAVVVEDSVTLMCKRVGAVFRAAKEDLSDSDDELDVTMPLVLPVTGNSDFSEMW